MIALCIGVFAMGACSKEKGIVGGVKSTKLLLSEISVNDVVMQRLEYNDKDLVTKQISYDQAKPVSTRVYTYNADNLPIRIVTNLPNADALTEAYTFDKSGKVILGVFNIGGEVTANISYQYEKNKIIQTAISPESVVGISTFTFDDRGNLLKTDFSQNSVLAWVNEWSGYDDKKGVAASAGDAVFLLFSSPNNPTKARHSFLDQVIEYDLVYTYNDAGYPTVMNRYNKGTKELVDITNFKYISANN